MIGTSDFSLGVIHKLLQLAEFMCGVNLANGSSEARMMMLSDSAPPPKYSLPLVDSPFATPVATTSHASDLRSLDLMNQPFPSLFPWLHLCPTPYMPVGAC